MVDCVKGQKGVVLISFCVKVPTGAALWHSAPVGVCVLRATESWE